jgi:hypothetical protein
MKSSENHEAWHKRVSAELFYQFRRLPGDKKFRFPVTLLFEFYRNSKRRFDFSNVIETVQDLLVDCRVIPDDSADHVRSIPLFYEIDKANPRCVVYIVNNGDFFSAETIGMLSKHYR